MSDGNDDNKNNQNNDDGTVTPPQQTEGGINDDVKKLAQELAKEIAAEQLKEIKSKLDGAYGARDEVLKKLAEREEQDRQAELARLQEEGKHKEAFDMQLAEERAKREALEKTNIELTRDIRLKDALKSLPFRNDSASDMAYREIVSQLVRNEQGDWVHRTGLGISEFVKGFSENDENSFLFKPKTSSGSGSSSASGTATASTEKKSLFSMSTDEVLKLAAEGKLKR